MPCWLTTAKMNDIDSELTLLKERMAALEEKKRIEAEKRANPMKILEEFIDEKKKQIENNRYSKSLPLARFYDKEKISYLEPILTVLLDIQNRLKILESKNTAVSLDTEHSVQ